MVFYFKEHLKVTTEQQLKISIVIYHCLWKFLPSSKPWTVPLIVSSSMQNCKSNSLCWSEIYLEIESNILSCQKNGYERKDLKIQNVSDSTKKQQWKKLTHVKNDNKNSKTF